MTDSLLAETPAAAETRGIARSASIIALGNITSRVLGLVREQVIAGLFGTGAHVDALTLALTITDSAFLLIAIPSLLASSGRFRGAASSISLEHGS